MENCPNEVIDLVIDRLAEIKSRSEYKVLAGGEMSAASLISSRWVKRAQFHHFKQLKFLGQQKLDKWRTTIAPDPRGISRHVAEIRLKEIDTLEGFEDHIRAFTNLEKAAFEECEIFDSRNGSSLETAPRLAPWGGRLVCLILEEITLSPAIMAEFLSLLPNLREMYAYDTCCVPEDMVRVSHPPIPFFEGGNMLSLGDNEGLEWIPLTAQFGELKFDYKCLIEEQEVINEWVALSGKRLKSLWVDSERRDLDDSTLVPLSLSGCTSLETLCLPIPFNRDLLTSFLLPSISSSKLSEIYLSIDDRQKAFDPHFLETLEMCLCRLAKPFKSAHGGRKMVVDFYIRDNHPMFDIFEDKTPMPKLNEEATMRVSHTFWVAEMGRLETKKYPKTQPETTTFPTDVLQVDESDR